MRLLRHPVASFIILAVLVGLCITIYEGFESAYGFTRGDVKTLDGNTGNIMDQLRNMNLISGVATINTAIADLNTPNANLVDIVGALASVGIGVLKSILGLATTPFEIVAIILEYYTEIPAIITELLMLIIVYMGFILLSAHLRSEV